MPSDCAMGATRSQFASASAYVRPKNVSASGPGQSFVTILPCLAACHGDNPHSKRGKVERQALGNLCGVARASHVEATA